MTEFFHKKSTLDKQFQIPILTDKSGQPMKGIFLEKQFLRYQTIQDINILLIHIYLIKTGA